MPQMMKMLLLINLTCCYLTLSHVGGGGVDSTLFGGSPDLDPSSNFIQNVKQFRSNFRTVSMVTDVSLFSLLV